MAATLELRQYQQEALAAVEAADLSGQNNPLVALPTGTGKTVVFCELIRRRPGRSLVLVHRDELITQTCEKLMLIAPGLSIGVVQGPRDEHHRDVVVASVQTLSRERRLQRIESAFTTIVVDEAHHATADSYRRVLEALGPGALVVGFTATPFRGDGESLKEIFPAICYQRTLLDMIRANYLSDLRALRVTLAADFNALHTRAGDFIDSEVADILRAGNAPTLVAEAYAEHARNRKGIVFVPTVAMAEEFASAFLSEGITAEMLSGETPMDERRDLLRRFRRGDVQVVTNCGVLTEGYDEPSVDCIVVARPTKSKTLYVQMLGRGTRRFPGKADCLVLDIAGATARHDLMTLASVFDLPDAKVVNGSSIADVTLAHERDLDMKRSRAADAAALIAHDVDLFQARPLNWVVVSAGHFVLSVGDKGMLHVQQGTDGWQATQRTMDGQTVVLSVRPDMDYTIGWAEDYARSLNVAPLLDRKASWRKGTASERQRHTLKKFGIMPADDLTSGEASDLIAACIARMPVGRRH